MGVTIIGTLTRKRGTSNKKLPLGRKEALWVFSEARKKEKAIEFSSRHSL